MQVLAVSNAVAAVSVFFTTHHRFAYLRASIGLIGKGGMGVNLGCINSGRTEKEITQTLQ